MQVPGPLFSGDTTYGHYEVVDTIYGGRKARLLYSGNHQAAQSGLALDGQDDLLFDYNQRFIELVRGLAPKKILLIGGGAFTLPKAILEEFPGVKLDVVEIDEALVGIAKQYFEFRPSRHTEIHIADGRKYLDASQESYDLILLDAFTHTTIPSSLQTAEAAASLERHLLRGGVVAMNIIASYYGSRAHVLRRQQAAFLTAFPRLELFPAGRGLSLWWPQNFILTAQQGELELAQYMRYQPLDLLGAGVGDAPKDAEL